MGLRDVTGRIARSAVHLALRSSTSDFGPSVFGRCGRLALHGQALSAQKFTNLQYSSQADIPASLVDQILNFVRGRAGDEQNYEVLQTGLRTVNESHPRQRTRLLLSLTELQADANQWVAAVDNARQALELQHQQPDAADTQLEASSQHIRACLAADNSTEASLHKDGISPGIERSLQGMLLLAAGLLPKQRSPLDLAEGLRDSGLDGEKLHLASALVLYQEGLQCLAQGHAAAADQAAAEDALGQALTAAEGVSGAKHVRVAPVLLLLAGLYARTKRVTLAEGLYRNAAKLLQMDPLKAVPTEMQGGKQPGRGFAVDLWTRRAYVKLPAEYPASHPM
ncbi:hypothetical protein WJX73_005733 [Symbiochloris irregularis]|uniref:Uncharacterized protein n=1 Tax=Symbiochloris irregularis TaxID=706552 RepID=A0AAW1NR60_9CHLO